MQIHQRAAFSAGAAMKTLFVVILARIFYFCFERSVLLECAALGGRAVEQGDASFFCCSDSLHGISIFFHHRSRKRKRTGKPSFFIPCSVRSRNSRCRWVCCRSGRSLPDNGAHRAVPLGSPAQSGRSASIGWVCPRNTCRTDAPFRFGQSFWGWYTACRP